MKKTLLLPLLWLLLHFSSLLSAHADGCFVWRSNDADIREPEQKALIIFDGQQEDLVLSVRYEGAPEDFGWIIPLPTIPEMYPEDSVLFAELSMATQRRQARRASYDTSYEVLGTTAGVSQIEVLKTQAVGIYDATVLRADNGSALRTWLRDHGYKMPARARYVLRRYVRDGWLFAALKIRPQRADSTTSDALASGTIQPVRFRFACKEPVFPLEITSIASDESEVLLYVVAQEILIPNVPTSDFWDYQIYSQPGGRRWIEQYERFMPDSAVSFLPGPGDSFYLTKNRATFGRKEMKDITFTAYDPERGLQHGNPYVRGDAATHLGLLKSPNAVQLLGRFLSEPVSTPDAHSALWALGEIGGEAAEWILLRWLKDSSSWLRVDAAAALGELRSRAALPIFIQNMQGAPSRLLERARDAETVLGHICFENLVTFGDESCIPELRRLADSLGAATQWMELAGGRALPRLGYPWSQENQDAGLQAVAALAACGEEAAKRTIIEAIVAGSESTRPGSRKQAASRGGSMNGFPMGFWAGYATYSGSHSALPISSWNAWWLTDRLLESDRALCDELYRAAARDERMPIVGAIMLLACLSTPTSGDIALLMEMWHRSVTPPTERIACHCRHHIPLTSPSIHYNQPACCVAYAMSRLKCFNDLAHLWEIAPKSDPVLRGEIIHAMTRTRNPRFVEPILEYIRDEWAANASVRERQYREALADEYQTPPSLVPGQAPLDLPYRTNAITRYLFRSSDPADAHVVEVLLKDRDLPAYLRLFLFTNANYRIKGGTELAQIAAEELEELIKREEAENPLVAGLAEPVRRHLDNLLSP